MTNNLSKTISALRTILSFQVVFLHAAITGLTSQELIASYDGPFAVYKYVSTVSIIITRIAVPLFFIISGYLFFINYKNTPLDYKSKIKARTRHLLQPIIIWTTLYLLLYYIAQNYTYTANLFSGNNLLIADYKWKDFIDAYFGIFNNGTLFVGQFWFLRNLFIICLFSPIIWYLYKYTKNYGLYALFVIWFFHEQLMINIFTIDTFFFFTFGAWLALGKYDIEKFLKERGKWFYPLYLIALVATMILQESPYQHFFYLSCIFFGIICTSHICLILVERGKAQILVSLSAGSFFCFILHQQIQMFLKRGLYKLLKPDSSFSMILLYFLIPSLIIVICYLLFNYLNKAHPNLLAILTGTNTKKKS